jgi:hypothetical protein
VSPILLGNNPLLFISTNDQTKFVSYRIVLLSSSFLLNIEPFVENKMNQFASSTKGGGASSKNGDDPKLPDIDKSVNDMKQLINDIEDVNLFTIVKSGSAAFDGLRTNGELSSDMFHSIHNFACDVESVSGSFRNLGNDNGNDNDNDNENNPAKIFSKIKTVAKDAWRCLRLSGLMKLFAEKVQILIKWIISLFQIASTKLGTIWGALSNARNVLGHSLIQVKESIRLCDISKDKSILLRGTYVYTYTYTHANMLFPSWLWCGVVWCGV